MSSRNAWTTMAGRSRALFASRNATNVTVRPFLLAISEVACTYLKKSTTRGPAYINETKTPTSFM